jgi:hypothetical protein
VSIDAMAGDQISNRIDPFDAEEMRNDEGIFSSANSRQMGSANAPSGEQFHGDGSIQNDHRASRMSRIT